MIGQLIQPYGYHSSQNRICQTVQPMDTTALRIRLASQYNQWASMLSEYDWSISIANGHHSTQDDWPVSTVNGHHISQNTIGQSVEPMDITALRIQLASQYIQLMDITVLIIVSIKGLEFLKPRYHS